MALLRSSSTWCAGESFRAEAERVLAELRLKDASSAPFRREGNFIIDVGMNDGSDTAYYLHCGFWVIAIEADPRLTDAAKRRFATEIQAGKLAVLNLDIAPAAGAANFNHATNPQSSFFSPGFASRRGIQIAEKVRVPSAPLSAVIQRYGVPYYVKVDLEGHDLYCIESLSKIAVPPYISVDFAHGMEHKLLDRLLDLGYSRFKLLNQATYTDKMPVFEHEVLPRFGRKLHHLRALQPAIRKIFPRADFDTFKRQFDWTFPEGSSGPFAEKTYGRWIEASEVARRYTVLREAYDKAGAVFLWDLHARI
jgi:FkbM family methyltransferase